RATAPEIKVLVMGFQRRPVTGKDAADITADALSLSQERGLAHLSVYTISQLGRGDRKIVKPHTAPALEHQGFPQELSLKLDPPKETICLKYNGNFAQIRSCSESETGLIGHSVPPADIYATIGCFM